MKLLLNIWQKKQKLIHTKVEKQIENIEIQYFVLNNGCTGYFPTEDEFDEGGYEVYWSMLIYYIYHKRVFPLNRNSATILIEIVVQNAQHHLIYS